MWAWQYPAEGAVSTAASRGQQALSMTCVQSRRSCRTPVYPQINIQNKWLTHWDITYQINNIANKTRFFLYRLVFFRLTQSKTHNVERRQTLKQVNTDVLFFYSIETTALDKCWSRKPCCGHTHTQTHTLFFLSLSHTTSLTHTHTHSVSQCWPLVQGDGTVKHWVRTNTVNQKKKKKGREGSLNTSAPSHLTARRGWPFISATSADLLKMAYCP